MSYVKNIFFRYKNTVDIDRFILSDPTRETSKILPTRPTSIYYYTRDTNLLTMMIIFYWAYLTFFTLKYWAILKLSIFSRNFDFLYACKISKAMPTRNTNQQIPMVSSIDILQKILLIKISNTFLNKQFFFSLDLNLLVCPCLSIEQRRIIPNFSLEISHLKLLRRFEKAPIKRFWSIAI